MLNYAKVSRKETEKTKIKLEKVISDSIQALAFLDNFQKIKTQLTCRGNILFKSDAMLVSIIVNNIISNSYKYYCDNGKSYLKIGLMVGKRNAKIEFNDNGIGIQAEHQQKIFDMFYRATDRSEGSGLGMYIVKQAVEKLNGSISLKSHFGVGTQITVVIPNLA